MGVPEPRHASHGVVAGDDPLAKAPGENFPVALRVLPIRVREDLQALYRFARHVDDIGDEPLDDPAHADGHHPGRRQAVNGHADIERRLLALDEVAADVRAVYDGSRPPTDPIVAALASPIARRRLPADPFLRLIEANRQDQLVTPLRDLRGSRRLLHAVGQPGRRVGAARVRPGDAGPGGAVRPDLYGPAARRALAGRRRRLRARSGVPPAGGPPQLRRGRGRPRQGGSRHAELRDLIAFETERAKAWLDAGAPLIAALTGRARLAVSGYVAGGRAACTALERSGYDPIRQVPKPAPRHVAGAWLRSLVRGWA